MNYNNSHDVIMMQTRPRIKPSMIREEKRVREREQSRDSERERDIVTANVCRSGRIIAIFKREGVASLINECR